MRNTTLRLAALSIAGYAANGFVNQVKPSGFQHSVSLATPKSPRVFDYVTTSVVLRMLPSFPEDTSKSADLDACSSSIPGNDGIESSSEYDRFADYEEFDRRKVEFSSSEDIVNHLIRLKNQEKSQSKFKSGDELVELRRKVAALREDLRSAKNHLASLRGYPSKETLAANQRINDIESDISAACFQDAEFCYVYMSDVAEAAKIRGDMEMAKRAQLDAEEARRCIPQLNMHGLWVGKYGEHGYEMINVTYVGDTMIATKVTGDKNVPRGEVSFTCNLSPREQFQSSISLSLEPIELNAQAAKQWGKRYLHRHSGKGQVAAEGYRNAQWMDGQLILVGRFFSFAWVPIGHQVFFGRPSPELVLRMFREQEKDELKRDPVGILRQAAETIMDDTFWHEQENSDFFSGEGCFE